MIKTFEQIDKAIRQQLKKYTLVQFSPAAILVPIPIFSTDY